MTHKRQGARRSWIVSCLLICLLAPAASAKTLELHSVAVATAHPLATQAGLDILQRGGNAFDAAVAVSATLAVVEPYGSGLGGGGFWLLHRARDGFEVMLDGRETAPQAATRDMFLDAQGAPLARASLDGPLAAAIPGLPAALVQLSQRYGRLPLRVSLAPAIRAARDGFVVDARYLALLQDRLKVMQDFPTSAAIFLDRGASPQPGFKLRQLDLAGTLTRMAAKGHAGFYRGAIAKALVNAVRQAGGNWQMRDLQQYRVVERKPLVFQHGNARIVSAPPPSSGALVMAESLHILDNLPLQAADPVQTMHFVAEAMRRAYQDRALYLGDPDFVKIPTALLLDADYAMKRAISINPERATPSASLASMPVLSRQGDNTTHFSIIDAAGNRVAGTLSINTAFGSGFVAGSSGVLLNNEMDDFVLKPGTANAYGLTGTAANAIAAGKRPLSSMSPTFVEDQRGVLVLGTPGGSRIISMVLLGLLDFLAKPVVDVARIVALPRYHHQYLPDRLEVEPNAFDASTLDALRAKGHEIRVAERPWGNMQAVYLDKKRRSLSAASDPRGGGLARVKALAKTSR